MMASSGIIIVEDEPLITLMVEQMVEDLGLRVFGSAVSENEAFQLLDLTAPAAAVLNVKLANGTSLGVAAACNDRDIPIIFTTGLPPEEFDQFSEGHPVLNKPFSFEDFQAALRRALGS